MQIWQRVSEIWRRNLNHLRIDTHEDIKEEIMRRLDREVKEFQDIVAIMERCDVCRIALNDNGYPYILPLNFGMTVTGEKIELYFHGATEGIKYDLIEIPFSELCV